MRLALILFTASLALSQQGSELTWEGNIEGRTILRVRGDRVDVDSGFTPSEANVRFSEPLPRVNQTVDVVKRAGRGNIRILEQPNANNDYTLVMQINPRRNAREFYSLAFNWEPQETAYNRRDDEWRTRNRTVDRDRGEGYASWSGTVDNEVFVSFRGRRAFTTAVRGAQVRDARDDFAGALPRRNVHVELDNVDGRGVVEILEQPSANNGYTAKVRIVDQESGAGMYRFNLVWDRNAVGANRDGSVLSPPSDGVYTPSDNVTRSSLGFNGMRWSGRVDGRIQVTVDGSRVYSQRLSGGPISNEQVVMGGDPLGRFDREVSLRKLSGREDVEIVQQPTAANGYRLVFEIDDDDAGPDLYEVELRW